MASATDPRTAGGLGIFSANFGLATTAAGFRLPPPHGAGSGSVRETGCRSKCRPRRKRRGPECRRWSQGSTRRRRYRLAMGRPITLCFAMADATNPVTAFWESVTGSARTAAGRLRVRSALNPMLWLCAVVSLPCFGLAWFSREVQPLATVLTIAGAAPIAITCIIAVYFALFKPEKLQSEDYQIRHEALELIKEKGSAVEVSPSSLEALANPIIPPLNQTAG